MVSPLFSFLPRAPPQVLPAQWVEPTPFPVRSLSVPLGTASLGLTDTWHGHLLGDLVPTVQVVGTGFDLSRTTGSSDKRPKYCFVSALLCVPCSLLSNTSFCYCFFIQGLDSLKDFCLPNVYEIMSSHFDFAHRSYNMLLKFFPVRTVMEQVPMVCWALL